MAKKFPILGEDPFLQQPAPPPYAVYPNCPSLVGGPIGFQPSVMPREPPVVQNMAPSVTVVNIPIMNPAIPGPVILGSHSARMICPFCNADISTNTEKIPSTTAWISSLMCCILGIFGVICLFGGCLIPFCIPDCMKTKHRCPNCCRYIGSYSNFK